MSFNIQTNAVMPQKNMAFRGKEKNLTEILKKAQREAQLTSKDCAKTANDFAKADAFEAAFIKYQENLAKDIMSKLNLQQAKNIYKK